MSPKNKGDAIIKTVITCIAVLGLLASTLSSTAEASLCRDLFQESHRTTKIEWMTLLMNYQLRVATNDFAHQGALLASVRPVIAPLLDVSAPRRVEIIENVLPDKSMAVLRGIPIEAQTELCAQEMLRLLVRQGVEIDSVVKAFERVIDHGSEFAQVKTEVKRSSDVSKARSWILALEIFQNQVDQEKFHHFC